MTQSTNQPRSAVVNLPPGTFLITGQRKGGALYAYCATQRAWLAHNTLQGAQWPQRQCIQHRIAGAHLSPLYLARVLGDARAFGLVAVKLDQCTQSGKSRATSWKCTQ